MDIQNRKTREYESGQTLILSVLAIIILVFAIIFLVDIQNIIRMKMKGQNAVDAAALAGANWQKYSLNVIGELNLIKACTVLISDIQPTYTYPSNFIKVEDINNPDMTRIYQELSDLQKSSDLLTEMQARVSFVGPLIGLGAAQLAAKNNGLNYNKTYARAALRHFNNVCNGEMYGSGTLNQYIPAMTQDQIDAGRLAYSWRTPYVSMLSDILSYDDMNSVAKGFAVWPNFQPQGYPHLVGSNSWILGYLQRKGTYSAILSEDWCALRHLLENWESGISWWGDDIQVVKNTTSFPEESEYLTLNIDYYTGSEAYETASNANVLSSYASEKAYTLLGTEFDKQNPYDYLRDEDGNPIYDAKGNHLYDTSSKNTGEDLKFNPLPYITWAVYRLGNPDAGDEDPNARIWVNYSDAQVSYWNDWLNSGIKSGDNYWGAVSYMVARVPQSDLPLLSGNWRKISELGEGKSRSDLEGKYVGASAPSSTGESGGIAFGGKDAYGTMINDYAADLKSQEQDMKNRLLRAETETGEKRGLPLHGVFDALAKPHGYIKTEDGTYLTPISSTLVLPCFNKVTLVPICLDYSDGEIFDYSDPTWYNFLTQFLPYLGTVDTLDDIPSSISSAYGNYYAALLLLNDPSWRQRGLNWLNANIGHQPIYGDPNNPTLITGYTPDDYNKDHCDDWTGTGPGPRSGPSSLH